MKSVAKYFFFSLLLFSFFQAEAKVQWDEPEVVPEKLVRKNRRVLRFSGQTNPNALIRIRGNRIKLYLDTGKVRKARIPKKNRKQFPVQADSNGFFSFDLYLPTIAVELPIEIKVGKRWRPYDLNFRVPDKGKANEFEAIEKSFMAQEDDGESGLDKSDNYYSRKNDRGLVVSDRDGNSPADNSKVAVWGGLGLSYFDTSVSVNSNVGGYSTSGSTMSLPAFVFGAHWDYSEKIRLEGNIRSISGSIDDIGGGLPVTGRDFSWLQGQMAFKYFSSMLNKKNKKWAFDLGFQLQRLPYFRERPGVANVTFFDNETYNLHIGIFYQKPNPKGWGYEFYARYLYPFSSGDTFNIESSFPLFFEFGGGIKKILTGSLSIGVFGQMNYFSTDVSYSDPVLSSREGSLDLILFTVDARLIVSF